MSGYRQGRILVNRFMALLVSENGEPFPERLQHYLDTEGDPP